MGVEWRGSARAPGSQAWHGHLARVPWAGRPCHEGFCRRLWKHGCAALLLLAVCGCFAPRGYVFTRSTLPYTLPAEEDRRVATKSCRVDITQIKEPFSRLNLSVMWSSRAVIDAMRRAGMTTLRYADIETLSIMNSVYERRRLIFYGD